jgi:glycosidase
MKYFFLFLSLALTTCINAQLVITDPIFAHQGSTVTLTYDASKGNAALNNVSGPVYAHAGLITTASTSPTDWKFVQGTWGTADPKVLMTLIGSNKYTLSIPIATWYGFPAGTTVLRLSFVFRNAAGTIVGRNADGSDIYYDIYPNDNQVRARFFEPNTTSLILTAGATLPVFAATSHMGNLEIKDNGVSIAAGPSPSLSTTLTAGAAGAHVVILTAQAGGAIATDTFTYSVPNPVVTQDPPVGTQLGATSISNTAIRLMLHAPGKQNVYVLGSFNDFKVDAAYSMKRSVDGKNWWIDIPGLIPGQDNTYQYLVDGSITIADPLSSLILDPANDGAITAAVFPAIPTYPTGKTTGHVSVVKSSSTPYNWQTATVTQPAKTDMIIYELLMRDFVASHSYASLLDTLNYLQRLGVNVIELMPVSEFENNNSWGYNVSYHMALDKYYGSPERFKAFVDAAHQRGMLVVLDVVYNHAFGQSPLARLYWDGTNNRPAADNPWLNPIERHPFNVGSDFNHESQATKDYTIRTLRYWLSEYRVDGFRFDLSKGFTQKLTTDVGVWSGFDQSRINILKGYGDALWATKPDALLILEHFADNAEETQLANYGFMLWGNNNFNYNEASMGFASNAMQGVSHKSRNWTVPHLVGYMESHDEERLMYKNLQFGSTNANYSIKSLDTALARQELVNAFFLTVPGPKMIWQFGELGYDFSINTCTNGTVNNNCRLDPKPIKWDYQQQAKRKHLFDVIQALIHLRTTQPVFETGTYNVAELGQSGTKAFHLSSAGMNVTILGNFGATGATFDPKFQHTGTWYNYLTGQSIAVANANTPISLPPGGYRVYTDVQVPLPTGSGLITAVQDVPAMHLEQLQLFPNPASVGAQSFLGFSLRQNAHLRLSLTDLNGRMIEQSAAVRFAEGEHMMELPFQAPRAGVYFVRMEDATGASVTLRWVITNH